MINPVIKGQFLLVISMAVIFHTQTAYAQAPKSQFVAKRVFEAPDIDGFIGEEIWNQAEVEYIEKQFTPFNGKSSSKKTEFRVLYDDKAIYVSAILYDNPDSIFSNLGRRDDAFSMNADLFIVELGTYNDGINSFSFMVSSSGVQSDCKNYIDSRDYSWDAVWKSRVRIIDRGWVVEMKIPHSALHFSKHIFQVWSFNVYRLIKRKEELSSWNFIDRDITGFTNQAGELIGIERIKPPLRLSASPWLGNYLTKGKGINKFQSDFKAGFDLKYGINQSFTLDAAVWPDFGQAPFDDLVLNVTPYETKYPEQRQFFNDGSEMFTRADLFYSRRVGLIPDKFHQIADSLQMNEIIGQNPERLDILNAFKITGRTRQKLGIGIMNVMTKPGIVQLLDTLSGQIREFENQSFTNYNVFELDKTLENNSFISFINTNIIKDNNRFVANVTGSEFKLSNRKMSYAISGIAALSQRFDSINGADLGFKSSIYFDKTSGKFQFRFGNEIISHNYNQNDMGFLTATNEISSFGRFNYNIYDPFWHLLSLKTMAEMRYTSTFNTFAFSDTRLSFATDLLFANYFSVNFSGFWRPFGNHDYYEARQPGKPFIKAPSYSTFLKIQSDTRKMYSASIFHRYWGNSSTLDMIDHTYGLSQYLRIQNRFQLGFDMYFNQFTNSIGYVGSFNDSIFMGQRNIKTYSNTFVLIYSLTNKAWINLKVRHYWSNILYSRFFALKNDGKLSGYDPYPHQVDRDFQMLNLDCSFKWEFAPGSQLSVVWKNLFTKNDDFKSQNYFQTFHDMLNEPHQTSFSIRLLYYLDFIYFKKNGNKTIVTD
jgi:hypothetical protein